MDDMLRTASLGAIALLVLMVLLMIFLADQLARQVLRPIGRFIRYVGRIADGDFSPIVPARRYRDEFSTLAVAINRMLDELKIRQQQLLQSRKMAAVGTLTSGVAHELNNPLNNISLTVETLLDDFDDMEEEQKKTLLEDIFTQVQRASATVRNLLDFTRKDQPVFTSVSIPDLLEASLKLVGNELALARVEATVDVAADLPRVNGNPRNLRAGLPEPVPERDGGDAGRRHAQDHRDAPGRFRPGRGPGHGVGHRPRAPRQDLRALLHDEGGGRGDRPGALRQLQHRREARGPARGREPAGPGHDVHGDAAGGAGGTPRTR